MKNSHDYTGKNIFVGIDVHKKTYSVSVVSDGVLIKRDTMPAKPERLEKYLHKHFKGAKIKSAYEAGFSGFVLHRHLTKNGIDNIVVNAASIEVGARDRVKTDKRDSLKIATQLSVGRLKGIFIPSIEMEDRRELTRLRSTHVKDRNRIAQRIKQKANYHGLLGPEDTQKVSRKWIKRFEEMEFLPGLEFSIKSLIAQWKELDERIKGIDRELENQSSEDPEVDSVYRSVKGIGRTSARILANELGDMSQFSSERALFSYTGLTPSEYSSGEHVRKGHITGQGKPILRSILVQASWIAIRYDEDLCETYERIASRSGGKRAIVAVARKLIGRIRACFRKGEMYKTGYLKNLTEKIA